MKAELIDELITIFTAAMPSKYGTVTSAQFSARLEIRDAFSGVLSELDRLKRDCERELEKCK